MNSFNEDEASRSTNSPDCWKVIHIPEKDHVPPHLQPTVSVLAAEIDPEHAGLNRIAPLENLRHVKRLCRSSVDDGGKTS